MSKRSAADDAQVAKREDVLKRQRLSDLDDVRRIVKTPEGLRFFRRLLDIGKVFQTTFTGNSNTYFLEGHRNLALKFLDDIAEAAPECIPELMKKQENEDE
jgi:hypothetical protein